MMDGNRDTTTWNQYAWYQMATAYNFSANYLEWNRRQRRLSGMFLVLAHFYRAQRSCGKVMFSQHALGRTPPRADTPPGQTPRPPPPDGHCSGWYASCWNAFLCFTKVKLYNHELCVVVHWFHYYHFYCFSLKTDKHSKFNF